MAGKVTYHCLHDIGEIVAESNENGSGFPLEHSRRIQPVGRILLDIPAETHIVTGDFRNPV